MLVPLIICRVRQPRFPPLPPNQSHLPTQRDRSDHHYHKLLNKATPAGRNWPHSLALGLTCITRGSRFLRAGIFQPQRGLLRGNKPQIYPSHIRLPSHSPAPPQARLPNTSYKFLPGAPLLFWIICSVFFFSVSTHVFSPSFPLYSRLKQPDKGASSNLKKDKPEAAPPAALCCTPSCHRTELVPLWPQTIKFQECSVFIEGLLCGRDCGQYQKYSDVQIRNASVFLGAYTIQWKSQHLSATHVSQLLS